MEYYANSTNWFCKMYTQTEKMYCSGIGIANQVLLNQNDVPVPMANYVKNYE